MPRIDLNADVGESFGAYRLGQDEEVIKYVTSANVACGMHAGDPLVMARTVTLARGAGVAVGAHPGYPDLQGFGRRALGMTPEEVEAFVMYQVGALWAFCRGAGVPLRHVKAHGSLYNQAVGDVALADAIARAVARVDAGLVLVGLAGSELLRAGRRAGLRVASEVFADRGYNPDGTLVPRGRPGAIIHDPQAVAERVLRMVTEGRVRASDGSDLEVRADTVCFHGDTPEAATLVRQVRDHLARAGVTVAPMSDWL
ncbi:MAG: 5-oxoprolinase subunit PxpA [Bacillota bacterium]|nr:5-oxoprolinase subunit PxpA [Bacillota bacterium]MDI7248678.1 5-oxoprolinase subunit PxpA [Bacillota bacterium]